MPLSPATTDRAQLASEARFGLGSVVVSFTALAGGLALVRSAVLMHDEPTPNLAVVSGVVLGILVGAVLGFARAPGDGRGREEGAWKLLGALAGLVLGGFVGALATAPAQPLLGLAAGLAVIVVAAVVRGK